MSDSVGPAPARGTDSLQLRPRPPGGYHRRTSREQGGSFPPRGSRMRVAQFGQRYPPALGGSEAYFARLSQSLAGNGDAVEVWTSNALDLEAFWSPRGRCLPAGVTVEEGVMVRRYPLWRMHGRRW